MFTLPWPSSQIQIHTERHNKEKHLHTILLYNNPEINASLVKVLSCLDSKNVFCITVISTSQCVCEFDSLKPFSNSIFFNEGGVVIVIFRCFLNN